MMTTFLLSSTLIFTLSKDFLRSVEQFAQRGTFSWNIFFCVEHFRGTFWSSWNIFVEHFGRRGTTGPGPVIASNLQPGAIYYIAKKPHYIVYCIVRLVYYIVLENFFSIASCI
jgi:hypothetical protein